MVLCLPRAWVSVAAAKCGLGSKDKGTRVEAPCVGAKRGLGLVASDIRRGAHNFEMLFRFVFRYFI